MILCLDHSALCLDVPYSSALLVNLNIRYSKILAPRGAIGVKVWLLTNPHSPVAVPISQSLEVQSHSVVHTPIIPDGNVIGALPLEPDLQVMVLVQQIQEPLQQMVTLRRCQPVDVSGEATNREDALPAGDWVCANDWVYGLQVFAYILGSSTRFGV